MAELADAYGSGPYVRKDMQVQVLLSAPLKSSIYRAFSFAYLFAYLFAYVVTMQTFSHKLW